jgi:hypothetical protein
VKLVVFTKACFATPSKFHFEFYYYRLLSFSEIFVAIGRERGELIRAGDTLQLAIRTTRVFRGLMIVGNRSITMVRSTIPTCSLRVRMPCLSGRRDYVACYVRCAGTFNETRTSPQS